MKTKIINIPGYTAEASLFNVSMRYQATGGATVYGKIVQPAFVESDLFFPDRPVPSLSGLSPFLGNCSKKVCTIRYVHDLPFLECRWVNAIC